jgi:DNA polymerase-3 subunit epsilon
MINLRKPLVFIDIESTGLNIINDRLIEISALKLHIDGSTEIKSWRVNPTIPIPLKIQKLIHIADEDVSSLPIFKHYAFEINAFLIGCDISGYNVLKLDLPLLMEEFIRAEVEFDISKKRIVDVQKIFHQMEQRNLAAAYEFYCGKSLEKAHSAEADALATYEVFMSQLLRYEQLGNEVESVIKIIGDPNQKVVDLAEALLILNLNSAPSKEALLDFLRNKGPA